jgi:hypothetical protein
MHGKRTILPGSNWPGIAQGLAGSQLFKFEGGHIFFLIRERKPFLEIMAGCM